jgi:hypothetical protein
LQGNIAELGNNLYQYGTQDQRNRLTRIGNNVYQAGTLDQGDRFTRTTEAIPDYVGREYSKEMRLLVKYQEENEPKEPVMLDKGGKVAIRNEEV